MFSPLENIFVNKPRNWRNRCRPILSFSSASAIFVARPLFSLEIRMNKELPKQFRRTTCRNPIVFHFSSAESSCCQLRSRMERENCERKQCCNRRICARCSVWSANLSMINHSSTALLNGSRRPSALRLFDGMINCRC